MSNDNTAIGPAENGQKIARPSAAFGARGIEVRQYDELVRFAQTVAESGLAPKGMEKPQAIFVAIQMGLELGLSPMAALQNVAVVNGRPTLWGDAQLAVCRGTGQMDLFEEWFEEGGNVSPRNPSKYDDTTAAVCRVQRTGGKVMESAFSVADAKRAGLWGKQGPWTQYPFRMLRNRARSFALRDAFGDALRGFRSTEEAMDSPDERAATGREVPAADVPRLLSGVPAATEQAARPAAPAVGNPADAKRRKSPGRAPDPEPEPPAADGFALAVETEEEAAVAAFWRRCDGAGLDSAAVMTVLRRNEMTDAEFSADLTARDAALAMPRFDILAKLVNEEVAK